MPPPIRPGSPRPNMPVYPAEGTEIAFNAIVGLFRAAPSLARVAVRAWDGGPSDNDPPSDDGGPWVRLTPHPLPSEFSNRSGHPHDRPVYAMPFAIDIETSTPGSNPRDSMRLWGQLFSVLHPSADDQVEALEAALASVGIDRLEVTHPAWGLPYAPGSKTSDASQVVRSYGVGSLEVLMHFGT